MQACSERSTCTAPWNPHSEPVVQMSKISPISQMGLGEVKWLAPNWWNQNSFTRPFASKSQALNHSAHTSEMFQKQPPLGRAGYATCGIQCQVKMFNAK